MTDKVDGAGRREAERRQRVMWLSDWTRRGWGGGEEEEQASLALFLFAGVGGMNPMNFPLNQGMVG